MKLDRVRNVDIRESLKLEAKLMDRGRLVIVSVQ